MSSRAERRTERMTAPQSPPEVPSSTAGQSFAPVTGSADWLAIEEACHAMNDAWRDMLEWQQLAMNTRIAILESGGDPNATPRCPTMAGIESSLRRQKRLGEAINKLSKMIYPQND